MLYRFFDCGIYGNVREPATAVWIDAASENEAAERVTKLLALTWNVGVDDVCVNAAGTSEFDIESNSLQPTEAGARRLAECGSWGEYPTYHHGPTLLFLGEHDRRRLRVAFDAARRHAGELLASLQAKASEARAAGDEIRAQQCDWQAENYRAVVAGAL